jgi:prepilin-type N-terminal cleavage/methylation domain-containing protein
MKKKQAFTLIELLTVISIIAILSAIIVPVFARAKVNANRSADITSMNEIRTAIQLYRVDQGAYPPAILGYATIYSNDLSGVVPADKLRSHLFPSAVSALSTFSPTPLEAQATQVSPAVFPPVDPRPAGSAAEIDLNGDGVVDNADDAAMARQAFGPDAGFVCGSGAAEQGLGGSCGTQGVRHFYDVSGYDSAVVRTNTGSRREIRYALFWTGWGLQNGDLMDDPRQLGYAEPHEDTIITWNSFYREYAGDGSVRPGRQDIALYVSGAARPFSSDVLATRSFRARP